MDGPIKLSEVRQTDKDTYHMVALMWNLILQKDDLILQNRNRLADIENKVIVTKGEMWGGGINQELGARTHIYYVYYIQYIRQPKDLLYTVISVWKRI